MNNLQDPPPRHALNLSLNACQNRPLDYRLNPALHMSLMLTCEIHRITISNRQKDNLHCIITEGSAVEMEPFVWEALGYRTNASKPLVSPPRTWRLEWPCRQSCQGWCNRIATVFSSVFKLFSCRYLVCDLAAQKNDDNLLPVLPYNVNTSAAFHRQDDGTRQPEDSGRRVAVAAERLSQFWLVSAATCVQESAAHRI